MNFEASDEQGQLEDAVSRLLGDHCGFEQRRAVAASPDGFSRELWRRMGEMGLCGLLVAQAHGGIGGRAEDLLPVMRALGRALALEPMLASSVLGATALSLASDTDIAQTLLPTVAAGKAQLAWAHDEPGTRHAPCWIEARATHGNGTWHIEGSKINVLHGASAAHFIVTARVAGEPGDVSGRGLFLVDAGAAHLDVRGHRLVDDMPAAALTLRNVLAKPLVDPDDAARATRVIDSTLDFGVAAACADMVGAMERAYRLALDYLNTRKQFGRLIGENQALRHRAAEMLVSLEISRSMALAAAVAADRPDGDDSRVDLMRAKLVVGRHARLLCQHAIQLHGGIGMTEEYAVGHCLRRVHVLDHLFGDSPAQASRLAALATPA